MDLYLDRHDDNDHTLDDGCPAVVVADQLMGFVHTQQPLCQDVRQLVAAEADLRDHQAVDVVANVADVAVADAYDNATLLDQRQRVDHMDVLAFELLYHCHY